MAWLWTLAPLPLLGSHIQTVIGSALTVFSLVLKPDLGANRENSFSGESPPGAFSLLGSAWRD